MSDFTDSLRTDADDAVKKFVLEFFDLVSEQHDQAVRNNNIREKWYQQGRKDALRSVLAEITGQPEIDDISRSSVIAYIRRGEIVE